MKVCYWRLVSVNKHRFFCPISFVRLSYKTIWLTAWSWYKNQWYFPKDAHKKSEGGSVRSDLKKLDSFTLETSKNHLIRNFCATGAWGLIYKEIRKKYEKIQSSGLGYLKWDDQIGNWLADSEGFEIKTFFLIFELFKQNSGNTIIHDYEAVGVTFIVLLHLLVLLWIPIFIFKELFKEKNFSFKNWTKNSNALLNIVAQAEGKIKESEKNERSPAVKRPWWLG